MKYIKWLISHFEELFSALLIFVMSIFAFGNVISLPLNFTEELNVYFFVWLAFLGSAWASLKGSHMTVTLIYDKFPQIPRKVLYLLIQVVSLGFFAALFYCGWVEVRDEIDLGAMTETLEVPTWWFTSSIPIGSALIIVRTIQKMARDLREKTY